MKHSSKDPRSLCGITAYSSSAFKKMTAIFAVCAIALAAPAAQAQDDELRNLGAHLQHSDGSYDRSKDELIDLKFRLQASDGFYFMGSHEQADKLDQSLNFKRIDKSNWSKLSNSRSNILLVDEREPLDEKFLQGVLKAGNFLITVGNTHALKAVTESKEPEILTVEDDNGYIHGETGYGHYVSPNTGVIYTFWTTESDRNTAIMLAHEWALKTINEEKNPVNVSKLHPAWAQKLQRYYTSGDRFKPKGRLNIRTIYYILTDDGDSSKDWWTIEVNAETIPGVHLYSHFPAYKTNYIRSLLDADRNYSSFRLSDYEPSQDDGWCTGSLAISMSGAGVPASWNYDCKSSAVFNNSDFSQERMDIKHQWNTDWCFTCRAPIVVKPGAVVEVPQGSTHVWNKIFEYHYMKSRAGPFVSAGWHVYWNG